MDGLMAILGGAAVAVAAIYDTLRLIMPAENRCRLLARLQAQRGGVDAAERRLVGQRLHGRIDAATYQQRMSQLARGQRTVRQQPSRDRM